MVTPEEAAALTGEARTARARRAGGAHPGRPPESGTHFAVLVKPEVMTEAAAEEAMAETVRVLSRHDVVVRRAAVEPAEGFLRKGGLLLHYPRLHRVAADGTAALTSGARRPLEGLLEGGSAPVLSAYEAMARDTELDPELLEVRCRKAGIHKLGSGSYASLAPVAGRESLVLNGFVPALATAYGAPGALTGLLECHSPHEISELRATVLGALHPDAADAVSVRGALASVARRHGIGLSEGRNAAHLSAGHLEAMFQIWRWFAAADGEDVGGTAFGRSLAERGVDLRAVEALAADHNLPGDGGETVAPHGATENVTRDEALDLVQRWTAQEKTAEEKTEESWTRTLAG